MTWWPSVPTRAVIAPTIAGSSSTTRIRSGRLLIGIMVLALACQMGTAAGGAAAQRAQGPRSGMAEGGRGRQGDDEPGSVRRRGLAPQPSAHRLAEALG